MENSLLTEVKAILKSLVLSCPGKITVEQLNRDYRDVEGQFIPYRQLGYGNLEQFLRSVPDTLRVFGSGPTAMVCFVANEKSDHIHDMIMKQRKPKTNARSKSSGLSRNRSNTFRGSNKTNTNIGQPVKVGGQQFSAYQSVNRNHMTKTVQVRNVPPLAERVQHVPTFLSNQLLYTLPQPNGILFNTQQLNPILSSVKNGIVKSIAANQAQAYHMQLSQINNLIRQQCNITNPPPAYPRQPRRSVQFSNEKTSIPLVGATKKESLKEESTNLKKCVEPSFTETPVYPNEIKAPTTEKQMPIQLSNEVETLVTMPKLCKAINPIEKSSTNLSVKEVHNGESVQNVNSVSEIKTTQPKRFFDDSADRLEDPDEAVPSFAAKINVFRLDFPEQTVSYGNKIPPYKVPDEITVGSYIKVFISEIHDPFKFWFHIYKDNHELDLLMYQIERYYTTLDSEDLHIPMMCLTPGQVCAACYNGLWHRAEIVAPPVNKTIKVSFMDYGTVTEVEIENVKFLQSFFAQLPAQALRGCLSHIKPRDFHWCHEATSYFLSLVAELMLYAKITEVDRKKKILYMILCDTNGEEVVQINTSLVESRYAYFNDDWKIERINQNKGKRVRHPREDFPTFSMIESGEYPSFPELVSLHQRGIDYEAIYDIIIYNQSIILNKHESASEGLRNLPYFLITSNPFRSEILLELYATTSKAI